MESQAPAQVSANLNRLQEQLHELHQRIVNAENKTYGNSDGGDAEMVIRGK